MVTAADADAQALENAELLERLRQATAGLLFLSETDAPFTPFLWTMQKIGAEVLTAETLRAYQGLSANAPVESVEFKAFFARLTHEGNTDAQRYRDLERLLSQHLSDLVVWRAGEIQVDIFIIGKTPSGDFAGVATQAVET